MGLNSFFVSILLLLLLPHFFSVKVEKLQVILGRTFRKENSTSDQIFEVEKYWIHEKFDGETYDNDIGKRLCLCPLNASRGNLETICQFSFNR